MKQLSIILLLITLMSCSKDEDNKIIQEFRLHGDSAEIPLLYFWEDGDKPIFSGIVKGKYEVEIKSDETDSEISGVFHLGFLKAGNFYEKDIATKNFTLKSGENIDELFIFVNIKTVSDKNLIKCPVSIKSNVTILPN